MAEHVFNASTQKKERQTSLKFEASLFYRANSRPARATEWNLPYKKTPRKETSQGMNSRSNG